MCNILVQGSDEVWFLDSGCSNHMSGNEILFYFIDKNVKFEIKPSNNEMFPIVGKGPIMFHTRKGKKKEMENVYFFHSIKHNIMSIE